MIVEARDGYESPSRSQKLQAAVSTAESVINDEEYKRVMRGYPGYHHLSHFAQATKFHGGTVASNDEPMDALLRGNGADNQIHLWLVVENGGAEGHTDQNDAHTGFTHTTGATVDRMTVAQLADHLIHEHMHRIGFQHEQHRSAQRCDSVPYAFGRTACQFAIKKLGLPGSCDLPLDWPPEQAIPHPEHGAPRC